MPYWKRVWYYWSRFSCDGCGKTKRRVLSDDGRMILCRPCRKDTDYRKYLKENYSA